jgi:hypothetical protein
MSIFFLEDNLTLLELFCLHFVWLKADCMLIFSRGTFRLLKLDCEAEAGDHELYQIEPYLSVIVGYRSLHKFVTHSVVRE